MRTVITGPVDEIVTLVDAQAHCHLEADQDIAGLQTYILAASSIVENITRKAYRKMTYELKTDSFCTELRPANVTAIVSVNYYNSNNIIQLLPASVYELRTQFCYQLLGLKFDQVFPDITSRWDAVTIRYEAGYQDPAKIPDAVRAATLLIISDLYENRESKTFSQSYSNPTVDALLNTERILL